MIAVEQELPAAPFQARPFRPRAANRPRRSTVWTARVSASLLVVSMLSSLGGGGLLDFASAYTLQSRAQAMHDRWAFMRDNGIPDEDLAGLESEWAASQSTTFVGAGGIFWIPGGGETIDRWQTESDAIWSRDLTRFRAGALQAEQRLHAALGSETLVQRKSRLDAFSSASTPLDFATLRDDWNMETRLIPIDLRIASAATIVVGQVDQAKKLGIRSDPAADVLARTTAYAGLEPLDRMAHAELLTRRVQLLQKDLEGRLDAGGVTQQTLQHASDESSIAALYGIDTSGFEARIANDRILYADALTAAQFNAITADLQQVAAGADQAIYVTMSQTHIVSGVTFIYQNHPLSCEEAATSMALTHQGIYVSQDQVLAEIGADRRGMYVDAYGRVRWGNPYETFVGNVNGSESNYTGFGTFYPPLVRVAKAHGARILAYGSMSAATVYARVIAGHPVVAFATWDWQWHPRRDYLSFDGQWIPWIGPVYASHVYTVVGVSPGQVLVNDPIRGQYWISKAAFEAGYSDFNEAIVFA